MDGPFLYVLRSGAWERGDAIVLFGLEDLCGTLLRGHTTTRMRGAACARLCLVLRCEHRVQPARLPTWNLRVERSRNPNSGELGDARACARCGSHIWPLPFGRTGARGRASPLDLGCEWGFGGAPTVLDGARMAPSGQPSSSKPLEVPRGPASDGSVRRGGRRSFLRGRVCGSRAERFGMGLVERREGMGAKRWVFAVSGFCGFVFGSSASGFSESREARPCKLRVRVQFCSA